MPHLHLTLSGRTATEWAALCEDGGRAARNRWQRYLSGRSAMPVEALVAMADAVDAGPVEVYGWMREIAERRSRL